MASFVNACVFTAASAGTGSFVVSAAVTGWVTPAQAGAVNGATYRYRAYSTDLTEWEIGTGTYTSSGTTLTRTVTASSNANATVDFTAAPSVALTSFGADISSAVEITGGTVTGLTNLTLASGAATPATNNAAALGTTSLMWADLFLAAGGVINFDNGDVTITEGTNTLTFAGASSGYSFDANVATTGTFTKNSNDITVGTITFIIDGGGSAITTGEKGDLTIPFACTINEWTLLADQSGSVVVDIWKDTYANYPPTVADTITGSAKPTISAATKGQSSTLTGWTTSIAAGDCIAFNVDSASTVTRVTLSLKVTRS